jgi:hypothetical protein
MESRFMNTTARACNPLPQVGWLGLLCLLLPALAGCGPGQGSISGQVLYKGKPLPGGTVWFQPVDTKYSPVLAQIDENGNYQAKVPAGEVQISVNNSALKGEAHAPIGVGGGPTETPTGSGIKRGPPKGVALGPPKDAMKEAMKSKAVPEVKVEKPPGTYVPIPEKYYKTETSGLKVTVQKGLQTHNIELQ